MTIQKNLSFPGGVVMEQQSEMHIPNASDFCLPDFLRVLRVRRNIILGTTAIVLALASAIVLEATPRYTASAIVLLDQRKHNLEDTAALLTGTPSDQATIQNQIQILSSMELAQRVVDKEKLREDPEFNPKAGGVWAFLSTVNPMNWFGVRKTEASTLDVDVERNKVAKNVLARIKATPVGLSTAIKISFESQNPKTAARMAGAVANAYVEDQLEAKFQATQKATQWLSGRISDLAKQAELADAAVQRYKAEHNITTTAVGGSVVDQQIAQISAQLTASKTELAEKQANYSRLAALAKSGNAAASSQVLASPTVAALRAQETMLTSQMANLSSKYGPRHPKILDLQAQKATLDERIDEEVQRVVDSAKNDMDVAASHVASLASSLREAEKQGAGQNQDNVQVTALQSAANSARAMYEAFLGRLNKTQGQEGIQTPDARVITNPEVPTAPSYPKTGLMIGASIPAGLMLGLIFAFLAEKLDSGFRTAAEVEQLLGAPVLTTVLEAGQPRQDDPINPADLVVAKPMSTFAEAIRGLQLGLALSNVDMQPKVVVVTSSVPGEGKTTVAVSLARIAARGGLRVVLIDGDLRRPSVGKAVNLSRESAPGLVDVLTGMTPLEQCLHNDPKSDAKIIPCGATSVSPSDLLASRAMKNMVSALREAFDLVIIDSAPLLPVHDTRVLGAYADAILFVIRWEKTPRDAAVNAMRVLNDSHAPVAGVALNRADGDRFRYYSYGYQSYHAYSKYYAD